MKQFNVSACTLLAALFCLGFAPQAHAASLVIAPAETTVTIGDPFTVRVLVDAVPDLKGADLVYGYTPGRLTFAGSVMGDAFASGGGDAFEFTYPDVQAPPDSVWYNTARLTGTGSGPGVIVFLTFNTHLDGNANINCLNADLRNSANTPLLPSCAGALVHIIGPVPVRPTTWSRLKAHYR
jgi:hypothetical protein